MGRQWEWARLQKQEETQKWWKRMVTIDVKFHEVQGKNYRCAIPKLNKEIVSSHIESGVTCTLNQTPPEQQNQEVAPYKLPQQDHSYS